MSAQPSLFEAAAAHGDQAGKRSGATLRRSFDDFHARNPQVYAALREKALHAKRSGWRTFGAKALVEAIRWDSRVATDGKPYRLDNSHVASYARLLMEQEPELRGFFRLR